MVTDLANRLANDILIKAKRFDGYAKDSAVNYIERGQEEYKYEYSKFKALSTEYYLLHEQLCKSLYAIEAYAVNCGAVFPEVKDATE